MNTVLSMAICCNYLILIAMFIQLVVSDADCSTTVTLQEEGLCHCMCFIGPDMKAIWLGYDLEMGSAVCDAILLCALELPG